jgi:protein-disulfide isomerase
VAYPVAPDRVPASATPEGDGILIAGGRVRVDVFIDFMCPYCKRFELSSGPAVARLASGGQASVAYHPMNFLDQASTTGYSTRAAAASGCAADQGRFPDYAHALFVNQPPEGGPGLSDGELAGLADEAGLSEATFAGCIGEAPYLDWPAYVTERATGLGVSATPTVLVDGTAVRPDGHVIAAAVAQVNREK